MTATPITRTVAGLRHPVRVDVDGDFALDDLLALPAAQPARRIAAIDAARAGLWRPESAKPVRPSSTTRSRDLVEQCAPSEADATLLHRFETGGLFKPPVADHVTGLTPTIGAAWLALAARWIDLASSSGDLRFLNTACKLTGAVWQRHHCSPQLVGCQDNAERRTVVDQLGAVARLLSTASEQLRHRLDRRLLLAEPDASVDVIQPGRFTDRSRARIMILAGAGSRSATRLASAATTFGLPVAALCRYARASSGPPMPSSYASAWYPPAEESAPPPDGPLNVPQTSAATWGEVEAAIRSAAADLVLLVGMPIVPSRVLDAARIGVLNAHNGALPSYRGMDAVGWALLHNHPIVCSLHLARPGVDAGEIVAAHPVPVSPTSTLSARVKTTQLRLLLAGAVAVADTGTLPDLTPQPAGSRQFYRLHPHLKRLLDTSPYARHNAPQWTVTQP